MSEDVNWKPAVSSALDERFVQRLEELGLKMRIDGDVLTVECGSFREQWLATELPREALVGQDVLTLAGGRRFVLCDTERIS